MFCSKCGTKALDGAEFCQKCGAKLIVDASVIQSTPETHSNSAFRLGGTPAEVSPRKQSRKMPIIFGFVAMAVLVVIFIAINWDGKIDYEASVRAHTPFADSQGLPYTYGEVFDKYIPDAK